MAKSTPDPLKRRHLIEADLSPTEAAALAEAYLAEDRFVDALIFLEKADDRAKLAELRDRAIELGDVFLMQSVESALGETSSAEAWKRLAESAEAAGKERYAVEARRQATARGG